MDGNTALTVVYQKATSHSLRPVTIRQLLASTQAHGDAEWMLGDCEINHVGPSPRYVAAGSDHLLLSELGYSRCPCLERPGKPHK